MDLHSKILFAFLLGLLAGVILSAVVTSRILDRQQKQIQDVLAKRKFSTPLFKGER